jgi:hypothetical protein
MKRIIVATLAALLLGTSATADPIFVTGSLAMSQDGNGPITLSSSVFSFDSHVSGHDGIFRPWQLTPDRSQPGMLIDTSAYFVGTAVQGVASYDGRTFGDVGGLESDDWMSIRFTGEVVAPEITESTTNQQLVSVTAPFGFQGRFSYLKDEITWQPGFVDLVGYGTVTVWLRAYLGPDYPMMWDYAGANYQFADMTPNPEPTTLILLGSGVVAIIAKRRIKSWI